MRVLQVASEAAPFAKTGGLADVVGALPGALSRLGCHARIVGPGARVKVDAMVDFESLKGEMNGS
jgi:starch synthase